MSTLELAWHAFVAGLLASVACGIGALPLAWPGLNAPRRAGLVTSFSSGLMFSASVYNLLLPALGMQGQPHLRVNDVLLTTLGIMLGCACLWATHDLLRRAHARSDQPPSKRVRRAISAQLVFLAMTIHSIPEGIAVGVGYGAEGHGPDFAGLGWYVALAIAIHNMPEGLAVALPLRAQGVSLWRCCVAAFLTSLPQPIAAVPAVLAVAFVQPLMVPLLGLAAGAMMYLVLVELLPDALETRTPVEVAWSFMLGFCGMLLVQAAV